jgi:hypothetical protein
VRIQQTVTDGRGYWGNRREGGVGAAPEDDGAESAASGEARA